MARHAPDRMRRHLAAGQARSAGQRRIGLMGGSFNPPHEGHLDIARQARRAGRLDEIWWLVSPQNPLKTTVGMAGFTARLAAARRLAGATGWLKVPDIETRLAAHTGGRKPWVTVRLLDRLAVMQPRSRLIWIMGADNLASFHLWYRPQQITRLADILVLNRPGFAAAALTGPGRALLGRRVPAGLLGRGRGRAGRQTSCQTGRQRRWAFIHASRNPSSATGLRAAGKGL